MVFWIASLAGLAVAYLLGSIPTGYLAGRLLKGVDIRTLGSGSTGATNVLRTVGKWAALAVLLADLAKGAAAILFARGFWAWLATWPAAGAPPPLDPRAWAPWAASLAGLAAVVGHSRPVWLGFRGGKSAAAGLGVLLALAWPVGLAAAAVFAILLAVFRIVSLSSMLAVSAAMVLICALPQPAPYRLLVIAGGLYVIVRHRANITRLLAGTEPRVSLKAA